MPRLLTLSVAVAALSVAACAAPTPDPASRPISSDSAPTPMTTSTTSSPASDSLLLFDFEGTDSPSWRIENDGVMGGRSQGFVEVTDGTLVFTGELVTRGGGFSSARAALGEDLSGYDGIELRVRGGGRTFELDVSDGTRNRGRQVTRRAPFPTTDAWETVRVPFDSLSASAHGQSVRVAPVDLTAVQSIGIYIIDGIDGPFRLEVDWIRAYREAE